MLSGLRAAADQNIHLQTPERIAGDSFRARENGYLFVSSVCHAVSAFMSIPVALNKRRGMIRIAT